MPHLAKVSSGLTGREVVGSFIGRLPLPGVAGASLALRLFCVLRLALFHLALFPQRVVREASASEHLTEGREKWPSAACMYAARSAAGSEASGPS